MKSRYRAGAAALVLTAACSSAKPPPEPQLTEAWRTTAVTPTGQPEAAGDTFVVYGTEATQLYLYGVAVGDGTVLWRQAASPGNVVSGIAVTPSVFVDKVAYFRPDASANLAARLVVADARNGHDLLVTGPLAFVSHPKHCADGKDLCVTVLDGATYVSRRFSLDALSATPVPDLGAPPPDSRFVGEDLLDLGGRQPETLAGFSRGTVRWRSPLTRHFPEGFTTDRAWHFEFYRSAGLHVGSVGHPPQRVDPSVVVVDLSTDRMAGIDAAGGSPAWQEPGTFIACHGRIYLRRKVADDRSELWPVRCRYRGIARYSRATSAATYDGLDVTVEGFDVATGKTTWSVPLGAAETFLKNGVEAAVVGETEVLVQAATGAVIVDVATGATRPPPGNEVFWCAKHATFQYREARRFADGTTIDTWSGGSLLDPCTADGSPTIAAPTNLPRSLGATIGDRTAVANAHALVAYDRTATQR